MDVKPPQIEWLGIAIIVFVAFAIIAEGSLITTFEGHDGGQVPLMPGAQKVDPASQELVEKQMFHFFKEMVGVLCVIAVIVLALVAVLFYGRDIDWYQPQLFACVATATLATIAAGSLHKTWELAGGEQVATMLGVLISALARVGHRDTPSAERAFQQAISSLHLKGETIVLQDAERRDLSRIQPAIQTVPGRTLGRSQSDGRHAADSFTSP